MARNNMKFAVEKHSVFINGSNTSVSLEDDFWDGLQEIAADKKISVNKLVERISRYQQDRQFVFCNSSICF